MIALLLIGASLVSSGSDERPLADVPLEGRAAAAAVAPLRSELNDVSSSAERRQQIAFLLARMGDEASSAVADLEQIAVNEPANRRWALKALALFKEHAAVAIPSLMTIASDRSVSLDERLLAAEAMAINAGRRPTVVRWYFESLQDARLTQAEKHGFLSMARLLGPAGDVVTPVLVKHLESNDREASRLAAVALGQIGSPVGAESLMFVAADSERPITADAAAEALNLLGEVGAQAFQRLLSLEEEVIDIRIARSWTTPSATRNTEFERLLRSRSRLTRLTAAETLLPVQPARSVEALTELATGKDRVARSARKILRGIEVGRATPPACRPGES